MHVECLKLTSTLLADPASAMSKAGNVAKAYLGIISRPQHGQTMGDQWELSLSKVFDSSICGQASPSWAWCCILQPLNSCASLRLCSPALRRIFKGQLQCKILPFVDVCACLAARRVMMGGLQKPNDVEGLGDRDDCQCSVATDYLVLVQGFAVLL